jgi:hypothetical protein
MNITTTITSATNGITTPSPMLCKNIIHKQKNKKTKKQKNKKTKKQKNKKTKKQKKENFFYLFLSKNRFSIIIYI